MYTSSPLYCQWIISSYISTLVIMEESINISRQWMIGVLGHDSTLLRLHWAGDNLGKSWLVWRGIKTICMPWLSILTLPNVSPPIEATNTCGYILLTRKKWYYRGLYNITPPTIVFTHYPNPSQKHGRRYISSIYAWIPPAPPPTQKTNNDKKKQFQSTILHYKKWHYIGGRVVAYYS